MQFPRILSIIYTASHTLVAQISEASERELHLYDHDNMRVINEYLTMFLSRNSWDELFSLAEKSCPVYPTILQVKACIYFLIRKKLVLEKGQQILCNMKFIDKYYHRELFGNSGLVQFDDFPKHPCSILNKIVELIIFLEKENLRNERELSENDLMEMVIDSCYKCSDLQQEQTFSWYIEQLTFRLGELLVLVESLTNSNRLEEIRKQTIAIFSSHKQHPEKAWRIEWFICNMPFYEVVIKKKKQKLYNSIGFKSILLEEPWTRFISRVLVFIGFICKYNFKEDGEPAMAKKFDSLTRECEGILAIMYMQNLDGCREIYEAFRSNRLKKGLSDTKKALLKEFDRMVKLMKELKKIFRIVHNDCHMLVPNTTTPLFNQKEHN